MVRDNIHIGSLTVTLPHAPPQECAVDVRFTYDVNGLLQIDATVLKTQQTASLLIEGNPGLLSESQIAELLKAMAELKIHPRDQLENRTVLARAERLYEQLRGMEREYLGRQVLGFERLLAGQDERVIVPGRRALAELLDALERHNAFDREPT